MRKTGRERKREAEREQGGEEEKGRKEGKEGSKEGRRKKIFLMCFSHRSSVVPFAGIWCLLEFSSN